MRRILIIAKEKNVDAAAQARILIEALGEAGLRPGDFQGNGAQARLTAEGNPLKMLSVVEQNTTRSFRVTITPVREPQIPARLLAKAPS